MKPPILLLGSGRCGSTLLQRILNTSPHIVLWGEHAGFLKDIATAYHTLATGDEIRRFVYESSSDPRCIQQGLEDFKTSIQWLNAFNRDHVDASFRNLIVQLLNPGMDLSQIHWGFKEIRYIESDGMLEMWNRLFPSTRYIFSIRHPLNVIASMLCTWHPKECLAGQPAVLRVLALKFAERWNASAQSITAWTAQLPGQTHLVMHENLLSRPQLTVQNLFSFLQLPLPSSSLAPLNHPEEAALPPPARATIWDFLRAEQSLLQPLLKKNAAAFGYHLFEEEPATAVTA